MIGTLIKLLLLFLIVYGCVKHIKWIIIIGVILLILSFVLGIDITSILHR